MSHEDDKLRELIARHVEVTKSLTQETVATFKLTAQHIENLYRAVIGILLLLIIVLIYLGAPYIGEFVKIVYLNTWNKFNSSVQERFLYVILTIVAAVIATILAWYIIRLIKKWLGESK